MEALTLREARRLALARAGLLAPELTSPPRMAVPDRSTRGTAAWPKGASEEARRRSLGGPADPPGQRDAARAVIRRFGYLQLDTVSIAGARSHVIVLMSRLKGFDPAMGERLLAPGEPLFEYWGHEASWIPMELYGAFEFRRREYRRHPWWGNVVGANKGVARDLRRRIRDEGPLRSLDMEGQGSRGWWNLKVARRVASALWSSGELAIRERTGFQRSFDLAERVIPEAARQAPLGKRDALDLLLLKALEGHGWATTGTLAATWRLRNCKADLAGSLRRLVEAGRVVSCDLAEPGGRTTKGWIRPEDRELAARLETSRPRRDRGVLLSPFDPILWDRARVARLFGFEQVLEIFKPADRRAYGYFCMPVLAGERLIARLDLKADRRRGTLDVISRRFEGTGSGRPATPEDGEAARSALARYARALGLEAGG